MNIHIPEWRPWLHDPLPVVPPFSEPRYLTSEGEILSRLPPGMEKVTHCCLLGPWMTWDGQLARGVLVPRLETLGPRLVELRVGEALLKCDVRSFLSKVHEPGVQWRFACPPPAPSLKANPLTAPVLLDKAAGHMRDRAATYDQPEGERSMARTVAAFNTITGRDLKESEGWLLLQLLKDVRDRQRPAAHRDSLEDCIAYAALKAEARLAE